jgi:hypothetical protein
MDRMSIGKGIFGATPVPPITSNLFTQTAAGRGF